MHGSRWKAASSTTNLIRQKSTKFWTDVSQPIIAGRRERCMSVQFGRWNFDDQPVDKAYLDSVKAVLASYGPDGGYAYETTGVSILYRALHTTKESRKERQPHQTDSGAVLTWDGRLDN